MTAEQLTKYFLKRKMNVKFIEYLDTEICEIDTWEINDDRVASVAMEVVCDNLDVDYQGKYSMHIAIDRLPEGFKEIYLAFQSLQP